MEGIQGPAPSQNLPPMGRKKAEGRKNYILVLYLKHRWNITIHVAIIYAFEF
jgi:hypothetical protein